MAKRCNIDASSSIQPNALDNGWPHPVPLLITGGVGACMRIARRAIALLAATLVVFANTSAYAAILTDISGQALVNRGGSGGYQLAVSGMVLNPGDVVVVNPGGAAQISYSDGCTVPVQAGAVVTVTEISPCANTAAAAPPEPTGTGLSTTTLVLGAAVLGGAGLAVALIMAKPASP